MTTKKSPYYILGPNSSSDMFNPSGDKYFHQTSPSWLVCIIRFDNSQDSPSQVDSDDPGETGSATSSNTSILEDLSRLTKKERNKKSRKKLTNDHLGKMVTRNPFFITNDVISVNINRNKGSLIKGASLVLKHTDYDYGIKVKPGDYIFIWMHNFPEQTQEIIEKIKNNESANDFNSGLKFVGKVSEVSTSLSVSSSGIPSYSINIGAKMFTELGQSVYLTRLVDESLGSGTTDPTKVHNFLNKLDPTSYLDFIKGNKSGVVTPDKVIRFLSSVFLGVGPGDEIKTISGAVPKGRSNPSEQKGTFNDAILVPKAVARILDAKAGTKANGEHSNYINTINFYTGIEKYKSGEDFSQWFGNYLPENSEPTGSFYVSQPLKGHMFLKTSLWENITLSSLLGTWLNPIANELYTCMRWSQGGIRPTIVARQIPFTTKNFKSYAKKAVQFLSKNKASQISVNETIAVTEYCNLPRWVIDTAIIKSINLGANSSDHTNFVQVFSTQYMNGMLSEVSDKTRAQQNERATQLAQGNFVADEQDIARHGLHAKILETPYDIVNGASKGITTLAPLLSAMQADFNFNNHLKWSGRVSLVGIVQPINEGDNAEIDGILYHIEGVEHMARIASTGQKEFVTILTLSNGILAQSLDSPQSPTPIYPQYHRNNQGQYSSLDSVASFGKTFMNSNKKDK